MFGINSIFSANPVGISIFLTNTTVAITLGNFSIGYLIIDSGCLSSVAMREYPASSLEVWKIVLIVIGSIMVVGLSAGGVYYLLKWRK